MMETIQNHKREFGIGAIILAVLLIFSFYEYHEKKQAELAASQLELNGNVDLREVSLAFRNSDRITEILVDEGDTVKKGQVLAKLDTQDLNYRIDVTKSQIAAQQAVVDGIGHTQHLAVVGPAPLAVDQALLTKKARIAQ